MVFINSKALPGKKIRSEFLINTLNIHQGHDKRNQYTKLKEKKKFHLLSG